MFRYIPRFNVVGLATTSEEIKKYRANNPNNILRVKTNDGYLLEVKDFKVVAGMKKTQYLKLDENNNFIVRKHPQLQKLAATFSK